MIAIPINPDIHILEDATNGYLIVRQGCSLLIDCPSVDMGLRLAREGLVRPDAIIHTHVQEEHCRQWASLADVPVLVPEDCEDIARRSPQFFRESNTVWPEDRAWDPSSAGMEKYGIGGCITERPPQQPLNVQGVLRPGETFRWMDIELQVIALPGHGKRSIGLWWAQERILFSGDVMRRGGYLVNYYDLERTYGGYRGFTELLGSLQTAAELDAAVMLPSTGEPITDVAGDIQRLRKRIADATNFSLTEMPQKPKETCREVACFRQVEQGIWQNNNAGNMILYIDDQGRGLCIDPDICVWKDWDTNVRIVHETLDELEKHAGLKTIEWAFITHYHGDHMGYAPLLRERYGTKIFATADVAELLANPTRYPYSCMLHWYNLPYHHFEVDQRLAYDQELDWHGVSVKPIHTPGHCWAHAGFVVTWRGLLTVCTGDTVQYAGGPVGTSLPLACNDTAWPDRSNLHTLDQLLALAPDLILCGHSNFFRPGDGEIFRAMRKSSVEAMERASAALHDGNLLRALTRPGFDEVRPVPPK